MCAVACIHSPSCCAEVAVVAWCLARVTIPASATYPFLSGGIVKRAMNATDSMHVCAQFSLGVFLAVGSNKHRMFAVLLWALRVHSTSAAARFRSASLSVLPSSNVRDNLCEPDRNIEECRLVSDAFGLGGLACNPRRLIGSWGSVRL